MPEKVSRSVNIFRSWKSDCWKGDLENALEVYTDRELEEIRSHGFNGIWLHQKLADYTPSRLLRGLGEGCDRYLSILDVLVQRAGRHGIDVYLYLLEPRAMEIHDPFWVKNPDLKGQYWKQPIYDREYFALCSSHPLVRDYLKDSLQKVTRQLPDLAGFLAITSGEDFSTCMCKLWSPEHFNRVVPGVPLSTLEKDFSCPRCQSKSNAQIISELIQTLHEGIVAGNPSSRLIAWDWGWDRLPSVGTEREICGHIPSEITLLSDFEIGGSRSILGKERSVNEYSLSYVGPSPRFRSSVRIAAETGREIGAKLQVGTTHELATVPNLPLIHSLFRKVSWARTHGVRTALATWNMGNMRSLNTYAFGQAFTSDEPCDEQMFYDGIVRDYLRVSLPDIRKLRAAWTCFEEAFQHYPYSTPFIYRSPINYAPSYWLKPQPIEGVPTGMSCDVPNQGDDLGGCLGGFTLDEVIDAFAEMIVHWDGGVAIYRDVLLSSWSDRLAEEYRSAFCALSVFRSTWHIYRLYRHCLDWEGAESFERYRELCLLELENCRELLPVLAEDRRLGFHTECQEYLFSEELVGKKIKMLEDFVLTGLPVPEEALC